MSNKKKFFNSNYFGLAIKNLFISIIIIALLVVGSLTFIHFYTQHGSMRTVPKIKGKSISQGVELLKKSDLRAEIIDSVYLRDRAFGEIVEQNPAPSTIVKPGRKVYLIVNSTTVKKVKVPNVIDMSLRQAEAYLTSLGFQIERVDYGTSAYRNLIIGLKYKNQTLEPETKIPDQSKIVLVAGNGLQNERYGFPYVVGLDYNTAILIIQSSKYIVGNIQFDTPPVGDKKKYTVYKQNPALVDSLQENQPIDLWLTKTTQPSSTIRSAEEIKNNKYNGNFQTEKTEVEDIEEFFK
ncbi:MAG: hypothetical protein CR965_00185 [Paludibacter sp.]|nr:MAG: hypothetical protein CR965_00185 [Paludibacter sp.]